MVKKASALFLALVMVLSVCPVFSLAAASCTEHVLETIPAKEPTCTAEGNAEYYYCTVCKKYLDKTDILFTHKAQLKVTDSKITAESLFTEKTDPSFARGYEVIVKSTLTDVSMEFYFKNLTGLEALDAEISYDSGLLGDISYTTGRDAEKVAAADLSANTYSSNVVLMGGGKVKISLFFLQNLWSTELWNQNGFTDINGEYFHFLTLNFKKTADCFTVINPGDKTISAKGHKEEIMPAVLPTCTTDGYTEGKSCTVCGEVLVKQQLIPALGHKEELIPGVEPTCTETGISKGRRCTVCGEITMPQTLIPPTGHTLEKVPAKNPTCTENGNREYYRCTVCGKCYKGTVTPDTLFSIINHCANFLNGAEDGKVQISFGSPSENFRSGTEIVIRDMGNTLEADFYFKNYQGFTSLDSVYSYNADVLQFAEVIPGRDADIVAAKFDDMGGNCFEDEINPNEAGIIRYGCYFKYNLWSSQEWTDSGYQGINGENFHFMTVKFNKKAELSKETTSGNESLPAIAHREEIMPAVSPTCTETGLTEGRRCSVCGEILVPQQKIPALGHKEELMPAVSPTCTETGFTEGKKCSVCGEVLVAQTIIPPTGHSLEKVPAKNPTCTENGNREYYRCTVCGKCYKGSVSQEKLFAVEDGSYAKFINGTEDSKAQVSFGKPSENFNSGTEIVIRDMGETLQADFYLKNYLGLTALNGIYSYDADALQLAEVIPGKDVETVTAEKNEEINKYVCDMNFAEAGKIYYGSFFHDNLWSSQEWTDKGVGGVNGEYFHFMTIKFNKKADIGIETTPEKEVLEKTGHKKGSGVIINRVEASCIEDGSYDEVFKCELCGEIIEKQHKVIPSKGQHSFGEWVLTEPTYTEAGSKIRKCLYCDETETIVLPKLEAKQEIKEEDTGASLKFTSDEVETGTVLRAEEEKKEEKFAVIAKEKENLAYKVYDINLTKNEEKVQPSGKVLVGLPLPSGFNPENTSVYYVSEKLEKMNSFVKDGKIWFETDHFSSYAIIDNSREILIGDLNGDGEISAGDARTALRLAVGLEDKLTDIQKCSAETDGNGVVTSADARWILRKAVGLE